MKEITIFTQTYSPEKNWPFYERRRAVRKDFSHYYLRVVDKDTQKLVGHLIDIGLSGFKLSSSNPILPHKDYRFYLELNREMADKSSMDISACSVWCKTNPFNSFAYNAGFQLMRISPEDIDIFDHMIENKPTNL